MADEKTKSDLHPAFTVDADRTAAGEIPSITRLLNRKRLSVSAGTKSTERPPEEHTAQTQSRQAEPQSQPPPLAMPPPLATPPPAPLPVASLPPEPAILSMPQLEPVENGAPPSLVIPPEPSQPPMTPVTPIRTATARSRNVQKLVSWDPLLLSKGTDPLGRGIAHLVAEGAISCGVFLKLLDRQDGRAVPDFVASAAIQPGSRLAVWTGMKWDPTVAPEMWNLLLKKGHVEFPPPGTMTNLQSARNVARAAFGIAQNEWLTVIRVGGPDSCRGLLAVVSAKTIALELAKALPLLHAAPGASHAGKAGAKSGKPAA